jgi:hypothetical protein
MRFWDDYAHRTAWTAGHPFPTIQHSGVAGYAEAKIDPVIDEMLAAYHR